MKKFIIVLLTIFLSVSCKTGYNYTDYYFTILSDGTVRFDGLHENIKRKMKINIEEKKSLTFYLPKTMYGRQVTQIGKKAFANCESITDITILNTITEIGAGTFDGCTNLKTVIFESPYGWKTEYKRSDGTSKTTTLTLTEPYKNAEYLKDTYKRNTWYK